MKGNLKMFKGRKKQEQTVDTIISKGTTIEGKVIHETSLRIDGKVLGEIKCQGDVHIGTSGYVENKIDANNIVISGEVEGDLYATDKVHIQDTGKLTGSVQTAGIVIDEGGVFNGKSTITTDQIKKPKRKQTKTGLEQ